MSFSFTAVGTLDETRKQVAAADLTYGGAFAEAARTLVTEALADVEGSAHPTHEHKVIIEANGHKDSSNVSLNLTIRSTFVPATDESHRAQGVDLGGRVRELNPDGTTKEP